MSTMSMMSIFSFCLPFLSISFWIEEKAGKMFDWKICWGDQKKEFLQWKCNWNWNRWRQEVAKEWINVWLVCDEPLECVSSKIHQFTLAWYNAWYIGTEDNEGGKDQKGQKMLLIVSSSIEKSSNDGSRTSTNTSSPFIGKEELEFCVCRTFIWCSRNKNKNNRYTKEGMKKKKK